MGSAPRRGIEPMGSVTRTGTQPPAHPSAEVRRWWTEITEGWTLDPAALAILVTAAEAYDMELAALRDIRKRGVIVGKWANPFIKIAREAAGMKLRALRALNLDLEPLHKSPGRPAGTFGKGK